MTTLFIVTSEWNDYDSGGPSPLAAFTKREAAESLLRAAEARDAHGGKERGSTFCIEEIALDPPLPTDANLFSAYASFTIGDGLDSYTCSVCVSPVFSKDSVNADPYAVRILAVGLTGDGARARAAIIAREWWANNRPPAA